MDQLLADETVDNGGTEDVLWPLTDWQGSVRHLASYNAGTSTTSIENEKFYDAYGNVKSETNWAVDTIFGYTGRFFDDDTGLQWNLNRWYDPGVGRWLSEDPIGFAGGDANLYRYVGNGPGMGVDPSGLAEFTPPPMPGHIDDSPLPGPANMPPVPFMTFVTTWCQGWHKVLDYDHLKYGCGGLMCIRAGCRTPQGAIFRKGTRCFLAPKDAIDALRKASEDNPETNFLLVAAQFYHGDLRERHADLLLPDAVYESELDPRIFRNALGGATNYCSLLQTTDGWCWETATAPVEKGGKICRGPNLPKATTNVYCVVPNTIQQSPLLSATPTPPWKAPPVAQPQVR